VSSSKLRGVLDERTHRIREEDEEDQRDALKSFVRSETSADREARELSFCSTREQQREQQSEKKREIFERKARGFKRDQSHLQISFAASFCVFLAGGVVGRGGGFFAQNLRKRRSKKAKKEERKRKRKRKRNIALYEKKDNTATTEQRQKSQHSSLVLYSSLVYVVYK
jgi:hypothetical protein